MKTEQIIRFETEDDAKAAAAQFVAAWGGSHSSNPYSPTAVILKPDAYDPHWRVCTERYSSAE